MVVSAALYLLLLPTYFDHSHTPYLVLDASKKKRLPRVNEIVPGAVMPTEREFQIAPIVPESVMHNTKVNPIHSPHLPGYTCVRTLVTIPRWCPETHAAVLIRGEEAQC